MTNYNFKDFLKENTLKETWKTLGKTVKEKWWKLVSCLHLFLFPLTLVFFLLWGILYLPILFIIFQISKARVKNIAEDVEANMDKMYPDKKVKK